MKKLSRNNKNNGMYFRVLSEEGGCETLSSLLERFCDLMSSSEYKIFQMIPKKT